MDGKRHFSTGQPILDHWVKAANAKGFDLIDRVTNRYFLLLRCHACGNLLIRRLFVVLNSTPECPHCIAQRRKAAAEKIGVEILRTDPKHKMYGFFRLSCGYIVRRQFHRLEQAAKGGHQLGCEICHDKELDRAAQKHGWTLFGSSTNGKSGYRLYRHECGHTQNVSPGNMKWGDVTCAGCGTTASAQPSFIYLFRIDLPGLPVIKLGYGARPEKRLKHQLGIDLNVPTKVLRKIPFPTGHHARLEEEACHKALRRDFPEWVIPKSAYGDQINTQGEIYHPDAEPVIRQMMDAIVLRTPTS